MFNGWPIDFDTFLWLGLPTVIASAAVIGFRNRRRNRSHEIQCPICNGVIQEVYFRCPHCGATLKHHCPACARVVEQAWPDCPFCNQPLKRSGRSDTDMAALKTEGEGEKA